MALTPPSQSVYAPGSLAGRGVRQIPSSKRRGTAASDAPMRQAVSDMQRGLTMPPMAQMPQTRQDRIIAARMDGTFDSKRTTFNQANMGRQTMDEAGNITPVTSAAPAPSAPAAVNPVTPAPTAASSSSMLHQIMGGLKKGAAVATNFKNTQDRNFSRTRVALERIHGPMTAAGSAHVRETWRRDGELNTLDPEAAKILQQPAPAVTPTAQAQAPGGAYRAKNGEWRMPTAPVAGTQSYDPTGGRKPAAMAPPMPAVTPPPAPVASRVTPAVTSPVTPASVTPATAVMPTAAKPQDTPMTGPGAPTLEKRAQALQDAARLSQATQGPPRMLNPAPAPTAAAPTKLTPPHLLFTNRAPAAPVSAPATAPRASDSYVSNPANRSIMTGRTPVQDAAIADAASKKKAAQSLFRKPYLPNRRPTF
jgi:hypothetical protein